MFSFLEKIEVKIIFDSFNTDRICKMFLFGILYASFNKDVNLSFNDIFFTKYIIYKFNN